MTVLRRFVAVGVIVTLIDVVTLIVGVRGFGLHAPLADAIAVALATIVSATAHGVFTFAADPANRWFRQRNWYFATAITALLVDVGLMWALTWHMDVVNTRWLLTSKAVSLTAAFLVRSIAFRRWTYSQIRIDQGSPSRRSQAPGELRLSLVIPAYKEADGIAATVARINDELGHLRDEGGFEIVVVDDGSPDATASAARAAGADQVIKLDPNEGKGGAVRAGVLAAKGQTIAFTDADLSYSPAQVERLMEAVEAGFDVVVGSRKHTETKTLVEARRLREIGGRIVNLLTTLVLLGQYRDTQCGIKAFRSDAGKIIFSHTAITGFAFDVEVFHLAERYRLSLQEVPVELVNSERSTVHVVRDTWRLVRDLFRVRRRARAGGYELTETEANVLEDRVSVGSSAR